MSGPIAALFKRLTQGVYVVGVAHGEVRHAFTAAWVMQVSFDPLLLALSINPRHSSYRLLKEGRAFSVNVLKKGQLDLAEHYGRPARDDKLADTEWTTVRLGGDHVLVLGKVINGKLLDAEAEPMSYVQTGDMDGASALFPDVFSDS
jgi:flavin reductase (DIM6/NTAB) family NADH-FMN oxidoreductase RutF